LEAGVFCVVQLAEERPNLRLGKNPAFLAGGSYTMQTAAWHNLDAKLPYEAQWFCCNHCLLVVMFTHSSNLHSFL
jgi:hypothetical protein